MTLSHRSSIGAKPDHAAPNRVSMPPGPHSLARLRIWSGAKNQTGFAPGNCGSSGDELRWVSPMRPEYFICSPKCRCSVSRKLLLPAMSTNATGAFRGQRGHAIVGDDLIVAAERFDEGG